MNHLRIPFGKPSITEHEIEAVRAVLESGWIGQGPRVQEFEEGLRRETLAQHIVAVSSCTAALHLALLSLGVGSGDEVIVPSFTWCSTANAAIYAGAKPVFCDICPETLLADIDDIARKVTSRTKAVIVVHFGGLCLDIDELRKRIPSRIEIIEDAAHALGGRYANGQPVGSSESVTCFSFYPNKNLTTCEGGAVATSRLDIAESIRSLRQHGLQANAWLRFSDPRVSLGGAIVQQIGYKMNMTDMQAALGLAQLKRFGGMQDKRLEIVETYLGLIEDLPLKPQFEIDSSNHARHLFTVLLPDSFGSNGRNNLVSKLREAGIGVAVHYAPLHMMPVYNCEYRLPNTEAIYERIMSLPLSAAMSIEDACSTVAALRGLLSEEVGELQRVGPLLHERLEKRLDLIVEDALDEECFLPEIIDEEGSPSISDRSLRHSVEVTTPSNDLATSCLVEAEDAAQLTTPSSEESK